MRTYWNAAEAALAKSLLDNYGIVSAVIHENASLYVWPPMAMPIRLIVADDQAEDANRILQGDFDGIAKLEENAPQSDEPRNKDRADRPWELLIIAFYFFVPGICVLLIKYPARFAETEWGRYVIANIAIFHMFGWFAVAFALFLIGLFFWSAQRSPMTESSGDANSTGAD